MKLPKWLNFKANNIPPIRIPATSRQNPPAFTPYASQPYFSSLVGGFPVYGSTDSNANVLSYLTADDVYSIVRRIARTAAMVPLTVYKVKDDTALKEYSFISSQKDYSTQSLLRKEVLKLKALEKVPDDNPFQKLLDNPNPVYSKTEFLEGAYTLRLLTGNTFIHTPLLEFGVNKGKPIEIWLMPSQFISLTVSQSWPRRVMGYKLQIVTAIDLPFEEVIHLRYFNPQFSYSGNELLGLSPLRAGSKVLTRQEAETDYSVNAFQNSGISGIVSNEGLNFDEVGAEQLGQQKAAFYSEAAGIHNARKLLFTVGKMTYTAVGLGPVDMQVLQSEVRTFKKLCNLYGISDILFNSDAASTESNVKEQIKQMYTNAALPEVYALRDVLNMSLAPKYSDKSNKYFIDCDITSISELQDDMKDMANIFSSLPIMNPNIIGKAFGWGESKDPLMDKFYIKAGYTGIDDMAVVPPLPVVTTNGN